MWKEIPWTKGAYSASDDGFIKSNERFGIDGRRLKGVILKPWLGNHGYLTVTLLVDGKKYRCLVHRLVAEVFIGETSSDMEIDHKDGDKLNNSVDNLEWVTRKENLKRAKNLGLIVTSERQKEKTSYGYLWRWCEESVTTIPQGSSRAGEIPPAKGESL